MYVKFALPNVGEAIEIQVDKSTEQIERGKYLANHVTVCMDCHSTRDWSKFSGPLDSNFFGSGGEKFSKEFGFPGTYYSKNITPYGIGNWTDGEIKRAIVSGVTKNNKAIFPLMPHGAYGKMDENDIHSIIAYLRTLKSIKKDIPESVSDFPMNFIINTIPQKPTFKPKPDTSDVLAYGQYLFTAAACTECHTKQDKGKPVEGMNLAGGFEFPLPTGIVRSANITADQETGIGKWSEEAFINRFKQYDSNYTPTKVSNGQFNTVMPWMMYAGMTKSDLKAIFTYLKTIKPVNNKVIHFTSN
jgi:mono/diheme cytochrome c family protein